MNIQDFKQWFARFSATTGAGLEPRQYAQLKKQIFALGTEAPKRETNGEITVRNWNGTYIADA